MLLSTSPQNDEAQLTANGPSERQSREISSTRPGPGTNPADPEDSSETALHHVDKSHPDEATSTMAGRLRSASGKFLNSSIPVGMWAATGSLASGAPSLSDIRRGSYGSEGWSEEGQLKNKDRRASLGRQGSATHSPSVDNGRPELYGHTSSHAHETLHEGNKESRETRRSATDDRKAPAFVEQEPMETGISAFDLDPALNKTTQPFENGYQFPPKHTWSQATLIGLKAFWKFTWTPLGFFVVLYGCLVVAFGGMLFLLLCNASPAMCKPSCDDIDSPRRIWVEYDSQIVNALFCVTGFGLIPWRFRDLYYLMKYRLQKDESGLRRLAGIHRGWFRLPQSADLPVHVGPQNIEAEYSTLPAGSIPEPLVAIPDAPLTGVRASSTPLWKLDFVIWMYVWNTFLQGALSGIMWGLNRYDRPSWTTGFLVAIACIAAAVGGIMVFVEGKKVKKVEGVPVSEEDREKLQRDKEMGILHFNNLKDEMPKEKKPKSSGRFRGKLHQSKSDEEGVEMGRTMTRRSDSTRSMR